MGLLNLLRKLKRNDNEARILVLGLDNSGKWRGSSARRRRLAAASAPFAGRF